MARKWARAQAVCQQAIDVPAPSDVQRKERLQYQLFQGDILARQGKLDVAERLLQDGVTERRQLFGATHPAYAAGLAALAELLLTAPPERAPEALAAADEAVRVLATAKHDRLPIDLALRTYAAKAANGPDAPALTEWADLPEAQRRIVAQQCAKLASASDPRLAEAVLLEVRDWLRVDGEGDIPIQVNVNVALVNAARATGNHDVRIEACRRMTGLCERLPDRSQLAMAQLALAMALADSGRGEETPVAYDAAVETGRGVHQPALLANVLRNYALWSDNAGFTDRADPLFREAVDHGGSSGDWSTYGQCTVAYGLFLRRHGRIDEARRMLEAAVAHLPPNHPDLPTAREQLRELSGSESQ